MHRHNTSTIPHSASLDELLNRFLGDEKIIEAHLTCSMLTDPNWVKTMQPLPVDMKHAQSLRFAAYERTFHLGGALCLLAGRIPMDVFHAIHADARTISLREQCGTRFDLRLFWGLSLLVLAKPCGTDTAPLVLLENLRTMTHAGQSHQTGKLAESPLLTACLTLWNALDEFDLVDAQACARLAFESSVASMPESDHEALFRACGLLSFSSWCLEPSAEENLLRLMTSRSPVPMPKVHDIDQAWSLGSTQLNPTQPIIIDEDGSRHWAYAESDVSILSVARATEATSIRTFPWGAYCALARPDLPDTLSKMGTHMDWNSSCELLRALQDHGNARFLTMGHDSELALSALAFCESRLLNDSLGLPLDEQGPESKRL